MIEHLDRPAFVFAVLQLAQLEAGDRAGCCTCRSDCSFIFDGQRVALLIADAAGEGYALCGLCAPSMINDVCNGLGVPWDRKG